MIVMAPGSLLDRETLLRADRDGRLCPLHSAELTGLLRSGDAVCSYKGCPAEVPGVAEAFRRGWRHVVVSREFLFEPSAMLGADHDGLLCHSHYRAIDGLLVALR